ncbi:MAG TPA: hypothetical protein VLL54_20555 [Pyrinomonadaceae bacterium]|nr:hypothetical protein [Pyrinomonadaceae bacterium]
MHDKWKKMTKPTRLLIIAPLALLAMAIFAFIGGELVKLLWNWLAPDLFGLRIITFWQAIGLLALCRILFGGFGMGGGGHRRRGMRGRIDGRIEERMRERWEEMTPEQRERFRQGFRGRGGQTTPLDPNLGM